jgi:hypothetical protein
MSGIDLLTDKAIRGALKRAAVAGKVVTVNDGTGLRGGSRRTTPSACTPPATTSRPMSSTLNSPSKRLRSGDVDGAASGAHSTGFERAGGY